MKMKTTLTVLAALAASFVMAADSTYSFTYQAALRDEHGLVISNGTAVARNQTVTLRLWDAPTGGNLLWGRTYNVYTDETGLFNLEVSDGSGSKTDDAPAGASLEGVFARNPAGGVYIGLFVSGSAGEIVPRQRLFAVPFAAVANDVRQISSDIEVGGKIMLKGSGGKGVTITASGISQDVGTNTFHDVTANGTISAGGLITAGGGLIVNGGTVNIKPDVTLNNKLTVAKQATFSGGVAVSGGTLTVSGSEVVPVPVGGIIMWTKSTPPEGGAWSGYKSAHWAICNGQNETPDLRGRFVVGANNSTTGTNSDRNAYDKGDTGGSASVTLTTSQMPVHRHLYLQDVAAADDMSSSYSGYNFGSKWKERVCKGWSAHAGDGCLWRTGTAGGNSTDSSAGTTTSAHENRPPYYALYYIMRIK